MTDKDSSSLGAGAATDAAVAAGAGAERRIEERRPFRSSATIIAGGREFQVRTLDLSRGGLCIVAAINPQLHLRFRLRLRIDRQPHGAVTLETDVQVVHSVLVAQENGFRVGLRFLNATPQLADAVANYLGK